MRIRGRVWIWLLLLLARFGLYVGFRQLLIRRRVNADLLVECGDHDGDLAFRDLPWRDDTDALVRPGTLDD